MKILLIILTEILLTLLFIFFASHNYNGTFQYECPFNHQVYTVSYVTFAAITYLIGGLSTVLIYAIINIADTRKLSAYKKEREKNSITSAEKDDKIKSLESKVKTLEKALDTAIKKEE